MLAALEGVDPQSVVTRRDRISHDQVYAEWEMVRRDLRDVLSEIPWSKLEEEFMLPWGRRGTVEQLVRIMAEHEREHCEDVLKLKALWLRCPGA